MATSYAARGKLCRFRVDVIGIPKNANFAHYVVEARDPEDARAKVSAAVGAKRLEVHPITTATLFLGWLNFVEEKVRLILNC
jgi:hypothetical protein